MKRTLAWLLLIWCSIGAYAQVARQRLILKDGTYQIVTSYEVKGDRVQYRSAERGDEVEEIPYSLVDWPATEAWKKSHAPGSESAGEQDAASVDQDARAQRADEAARRPEIVPGLRLPDASGVWAMDTFQGTPEVVRVEQADGDLNRATGHSVRRAPFPRLGERGAARPLLRLAGYRAKVSFHVAEPVLYVNLDPPIDEARPAPAGSLTVDTHGASGAADRVKGEAASPDSRYIVVRALRDKTTRVVSMMELAELNAAGASRQSASQDTTAMRTEVLPGRHWMKLTPRTPLDLGQYVLVEQLPSGDVNLDAWDFGVEPQAPENKGAFGPLAR